jgi:hypothetical protein
VEVPAVPPPPRAPRNPHWQFDGGYLVHDVGRKSLDAHCENPAHDFPGNPCRRNRTLEPGKTSARGRPLGLLCRWLEAAHKLTAEEHCDMLVLKRQTAEDRAFLAWDHRNASRLQAVATYPVLATLERKPRDGEREEPDGLA